MGFLFEFLYIMGSISTLYGTLLVAAYYWAHVNGRGTLKFFTKFERN